MNRRLFAAALLLAATPLAAQAPPADPAALVRAFYAPEFDAETMPMSPRLARLYRAAVANSRKIEQPVAGLDFSWIVNGQDSDEDTLKSMRIGEVKRDGAKASVAVTFRNGGPMALRYDLLLVDGKWLVDDIHSTRKPIWTISKMLAIGAKEK